MCMMGNLMDIPHRTMGMSFLLSLHKFEKLHISLDIFAACSHIIHIEISSFHDPMEPLLQLRHSIRFHKIFKRLQAAAASSRTTFLTPDFFLCITIITASPLNKF